MRSSLVGLQLLLACVLVWGTSVPEEENSTSQEPEKEEEKPADPAEPNSEEELEERGKEYRERMQKNRGSPYELMFLKQEALDYFNKHNAHSTDPFYRPIEDTEIQVKSATGTILTFTQYLVNTNCTKEEGRRFSAPWYEQPESTVPCVVLPKEEQKKLKCRVYLFLDALSSRSAVLRQDCEPVVVLEPSDDPMDLDHLLDSLHEPFGPSF